MHKVRLKETLATFSDHWSPKIVGELNGQQVKLVKFQGEFVWHHHEAEDEMFLVVQGSFRMDYRDPSGCPQKRTTKRIDFHPFSCICSPAPIG